METSVKVLFVYNIFKASSLSDPVCCHTVYIFSFFAWGLAVLSPVLNETAAKRQTGHLTAFSLICFL